MRKRFMQAAIAISMTWSLTSTIDRRPTLAEPSTPAEVSPGPQASNDVRSVDVNWVNADIHQAIASIEQQTGAQIEFAESSSYKPVTLQGRGIPLAKALRYIALSANAEVMRNGDGIYHFSPSPQSDPPKPKHDHSEYHCYRLNVLRANPRDILSILGWDEGVQAHSLPDGVDHIYAIQGNPNSLLIHATPAGLTRIRTIVDNLKAAPRTVRVEVDLVTASLNQLTSVVMRNQGAPKFGEFGLDQEHAQLALDGAIVTPIAIVTTKTDTMIPITFPPSTLSYTPKMPDGGSILELTTRVNPDNTVTLSQEWARVDNPGASPDTSSRQWQRSVSVRTLITVRSGESIISVDSAAAYTPNPPLGLMSVSDIEDTLSPGLRSPTEIGRNLLITPTIVDHSDVNNHQGCEQ